MPTDREYLKAQQAGVLGTSGATSAIAEIDTAHSLWIPITKASDDAMASTTTAETFAGVLIPFKARVLAIKYVATTGGITADGTNNATITISKRDSAGGTKTTVCAVTTNVAFGNVTQGAAKSFASGITAANVIITADSTLTYEIAKGGTGVVVRAGTIWVQVTAV